MAEYTIRQNWVDYSKTCKNRFKAIADCAFSRFLADHDVDGEFLGCDFDVMGYRVLVVVKPMDYWRTEESFSILPIKDKKNKVDIYMFAHFFDNKVIFDGWISYHDFWAEDVTMYSRDTAFYPDNQLKDFEEFELLFIPH